MKHPNDMVQMDILGPFYTRQSSARNYTISCIDDCSRKVVGKWCKGRTAEEWVKLHSKPMKVMHDGGKEFTSTY